MSIDNASSPQNSVRKYIILGEIVALPLAFILLTQLLRTAPSAAVVPTGTPPTPQCQVYLPLIMKCYPWSVEVWMTTTSDARGRTVVKRLEQQAVVTFTNFVSPTDGRLMIWVSETTTYQQVEGFGASLTDSSAWLLNQKVVTSTREQVMQALFDPVSGIGLSFLRNPMGASDFTCTREPYSYDDLDDCSGSDLPNFSITHDLTDTVPLTLWARQLNPELVLMGSPWSAPGQMKTNGTMLYKWGGSLLPECYPYYANYFVKYLQSYQQQGLNVDYISLQNEPGCCKGNMTPGMDMSGEEARTFLEDYLLPAMRANSITTTKIFLLDYNWSNSGWVDDLDSLLHDPLIEGIAWHGYEDLSGITTQTEYHDKYPWLGTYLTEHSGGAWVCNQMRQDFLEIVAQMRNWSRSLVKWNLALNEHGGPTLNSDESTCTPLVTVYSDGPQAGQAYTYTVEYYTLGHLSKFVRPRAYRIGSSENQELPNVAFKNPDGSKVLIVYNDTPVTQTMTVVWGTQSFDYTVPAAAGLTFRWCGDQEGITPTPWVSTPYHEMLLVPGVIQAEDYDLGGESVAYHDVDPKNWGGKYRPTEGVDIEECSDICSGYYVTRTQAGEWLKYTVAVTSTDQYTLTARVASSGPGGTFHLESDGLDVSGPLVVPNTGGWQNWQDVVHVVSLISGTHVLRLVMDSVGSTGQVGDFDYLQFELADTSSGSSRPYYGTPMPVPGEIQAEDYDLGVEGVAYHDTDAVNQGNQLSNNYRRTGGVDIEKCTDLCDGHDVGWTQPGEWLQYTVAITPTGLYTLTVRVAVSATVSGGTFHLESDGLDVSGPMAVPNTCGWQNWQDVVRVVYLISGTHVLRLVMDSAGPTGYVGNFNYLSFKLAGTSGTNTPYYGTPAPVPGLIQVEDFDRGGEGVAYHDVDPENRGGKYRKTEGVDIGQCSGGCSEDARKIGHIGYNVGHIRPGEWLTYTVEITPAGLYTLTVPVASGGPGGTFHLESDGADITWPMVVTDTGGWQDWQDTVRVISLTSGTHVLQLVIDSANGTDDVVNLDYLRFELADTPGGSNGPDPGTPAFVPGTIQAEDFDRGGEGAAYHDTDAVNQGNQCGNDYRMTEGVDIETCRGDCTKYNVGWTKAGEWLIYTVAITPSGLYTLTARVASNGPGGIFHLESDGADVSGPMVVPNTDGWQNWQDVVRVVYLGPGTHVLRLAMDSTNCAGSIVGDIGNFDYLRLELADTPGSSTPSHGTPAPVPGKIQVEDFDRGGEGMAYQDTDPENWGGQYRPTEGVDIECRNDTCTEYDVAYTKAGEWLKYTVEITSGGRYRLAVRVAVTATVSGGTFHLESDGRDVSGPITVPNTGGWQNWQEIVGIVSLEPGRHVLRLVIDSANSAGDVGNFDYFVLMPIRVYIPYVTHNAPR